MPPREWRILHVADTANARDAPARKLCGKLLRALAARRETDRRNLAANTFAVTQRFAEVWDRFHVNKSIQTRELELRVGLVNDRPRRRFLALPKLHVAH